MACRADSPVIACQRPIAVSMFALMQRNSAHLTDYFRLPPDAVVEIGRQISI
jgi:K+ transporter